MTLPHGANRLGWLKLRATACMATLAWIGLTGCGASGPEPEDPGSKIIARVGKKAITRSEFESYLTSTMGGTTDITAAEPELKSRVLDQFLDDELLVSAARKAGVQVTDEEIAGFLPTGAEGTEAVRRILMTRKLKESVILKGVKVSPEEIQKYFDEHVDEYRHPARVVLRQILMDSENEAERARSELVKQPDQFERIAEMRSLAPDGGQPQALEEEVLPDSVRAAVASLAEGELSQVVKDPLGFYILKVEKRQPAREPRLEEVRDRIEVELLSTKSQQRYLEYVSSLRAENKVEIVADQLGFEYVKRDRKEKS